MEKACRTYYRAAYTMRDRKCFAPRQPFCWRSKLERQSEAKVLGEDTNSPRLLCKILPMQVLDSNSGPD